MTALIDQSSRSCPRCGAPFGEHARLGFCGRCAAAVSLAAPDAITPSDAELAAALPWTAAGASRGPRWGDYELLEEIARGGTGVVFRARQRSLNRIVAVKMLLFARLADADQLRRFRNEATAAAALEHPNIVRLLDAGEHEGQPFIAMEHVAGSDLARAIRDRPWPARQTAVCVGKIARAVDFAHRQGVLHRDLKPSNVLVDAFDEPRVTDFGLARNLADDAGLTVAGQTIGSPNFMPPEQARGDLRQVGPASDVYGLGAILYNLLTTRPPFLGETMEATLAAVREREPVPPRRINPSIPPDLETICLKCLEKDPSRRYQSGQEMAEELDRFLGHEPILARPIGPMAKLWRWRRRKPALAAAISSAALFLFAGLAGVIWQWGEARRHASRAETAALSARRAQYASDMNLAHQALQEGDLFRTRQLLERHRALAARMETSRRETTPGTSDGGALEREANGQSAPDTLPSDSNPLSSDLRGWEWRYLWRETRGDPHRLLAQLDKPVTSVGALPDGLTIFGSSWDRTVRFWNLDAGSELGILPHPEKVQIAAHSPDGQWLVTATTSVDSFNDPVRLWDAAAKKETAILTTNFWLRPTAVFSPDGEWLALAGQYSGIHLWSSRSWQRATNLPSNRGTLGPVGVAFSPDSQALAYGEHDSGDIVLWSTLTRTSVGRLTGHTSGIHCLMFSPDGQTLFSAGRDRLVKAWDLPKARERFTFSGHRSGISCMAVSPDGHTLATAGWDQRVRLIDAHSGQLTAELRGHLKEANSVVFTRDGRRLISGGEDGSVRIWDVPPASREAETRPIPPGLSWAWQSYGPALALAPDGSALAVVFTNQTFSLWRTASLQESARYPLPFTNTTIAAVAPGGLACAFGSADGRVALWDAVRALSRPFAQPETNDLNRLAYSDDGTLLAMSSDRFVRVWNVREQREAHVFSNDGINTFMSLAFSSSSRHLLAGFFNGRVKVWNLAEGGREQILTGHERQVRGLLMLPDDRTLITTGAEIRVWDVPEGRELFQLTPRVTGFFGPALSPDQRRLAVGAIDGLITLWDIASWKEVITLTGSQENARHLAFSPDGSTLISASPDHLRLFRADPIVRSSARSR